MVAELSITPASELPAEFDALLEESRAEGYEFVERLLAEWRSGVNRFRDPGEVFLVARLGDALAGVGGINCDPYTPEPDSTGRPIGRLRHIYIAHRFRRCGVGRALVLAALDHARPHFTVVRLRTPTRDGDLFYRALGFSPDTSPHATHRLTLAGAAPHRPSPSGVDRFPLLFAPPTV